MTQKLTSAQELLEQCKLLESFPDHNSSLILVMCCGVLCDVIYTRCLNITNNTYFAFCGYLAPEYAMRGHLTEKVDVFSFGVVALEIISGRANSDSSLDSEKIYLLEWAWSLHESNQSLGLIDPRLTEFNEIEALRVIAVALLCTQGSPALRPPMSRVLSMLTGDIEVEAVSSKPSYLTDWDFKDMTRSSLSEDIDASSSKSSYSKKKSQPENATDLSSGDDPLVSTVNDTRFSGVIADGK